MKKSVYNPATLAPPVGHFERAVRFDDWLFISGTSALTNVSGPLKDRVIVKGIEAQTNETLDNIERVLEAAGGRLDQIYELRITLVDPKNFSTVDGILRKRMPNRGFIAHAYGGALVHPDMEIEIEANAYLGAVEGSSSATAS